MMMMKRKTSINIEDGLINKAKSQGLKISQFVETKLRTFLNKDDIPKLRKELVNKISYCSKCKKRFPLKEVISTYFIYDNKLQGSVCFDCYHNKSLWENCSNDIKEEITDESLIEGLKSTTLFNVHSSLKKESKDEEIRLKGDEMIQYLLKLKLKEIEDTI